MAIYQPPLCGVGLGVVAGAGSVIAVVAYQTALGYEVQAESGTTLSS